MEFLGFRVKAKRPRVQGLVMLKMLKSGPLEKDGCQNYGPFLGPHYNTAPNI